VLNQRPAKGKEGEWGTIREEKWRPTGRPEVELQLADISMETERVQCVQVTGRQRAEGRRKDFMLLWNKLLLARFPFCKGNGLLIASWAWVCPNIYPLITLESIGRLMWYSILIMYNRKLSQPLHFSNLCYSQNQHDICAQFWGSNITDVR
jgi:hypothetical protein